MAILPYPEMSDLSEEVRAHVERFAADHGRPSLLRWMLGWSPSASEAMEGLYHPIFASCRLDRRLKELLFVAASEQRQCFYCMGGHSRFLVNEYGYDRDDVERMRRGETVEHMDPAEHALVMLIRRAATDGEPVTPDDIAAVRAHGWDDDSIVEALAAGAQAHFTNTFAQAVRLEDDIEPSEGLNGYF
jgi:alkylhydroperoxidase family enzyme